MRPLLIAVSGLGLALVMFVSGLIAATAFFSAEPERQLSLATDKTDVWTNQAVKVNTAVQEFDRLPARPAPQQLQTKSAVDTSPRTADVANAGEERSATEAERQSQDVLQAEMVTAHVEWCSSRYRSYRPYDNSYTPYSGGRRDCISPYFGAPDGSMSR
jgi:hypothetical protein